LARSHDQSGRGGGPYAAAALREQPDLRRDLDLAERAGVDLDAFYALPDVELRIAAWHADQERCKVHGGPYSECGDDKRDWFPQRIICQPEAQLLAAKRLFDLLHKDKPYHDGKFLMWAEVPSRLTPFHYADATRFFMSPIELSPWDNWTTDRHASPDKPDNWDESVAEQAPDQQPEADQGNP
jgi:hypothetical protein